MAQHLRRDRLDPGMAGEGAALMAQAKTEFELKLTGPERDVIALRSLSLVEECAAGPEEWERLTSIYYDSADGRLAAAGLSLRTRNDPGGEMLSAKLAPKGAGPIARLECERLLAPGAARFITGDAEIDRIIGENTDDLTPIARTRTDRWSRLIAFEGAMMELSAEIGQSEKISAESVASPIAEIEIELIKGDAAAVFAVGRRLIDATDGRLRPCAAAKLERALSGGRAKAEKSRRVAVNPEAAAIEALAQALTASARAVALNSEAAIAEHDSGAARRLRVALRRLRTFERLFRRAVDDNSLRDLARQAREWGRLVAKARDIDVFIAESLPLADDPGLRARVEARLAAAWFDAGAGLSTRDFASFILDLFSAAYLQRWRLSLKPQASLAVAQYAEEVLEKRWRRLVDAGEAADFSAPATLHPLRIRLKKFRYAAQIFRDLYEKEIRGDFFSAMSALQDAFGAVNDAVVAQEIADAASAGAGAPAARAAGFIAGYRSAQSSAAAAALQTGWEAFSAMAPFWRESAVSRET